MIKESLPVAGVIPIAEVATPPTINHGKPHTYSNHKCRCAACRAAWAIYMKAANARRRALGKCVACSELTVSGHWRCARHMEIARNQQKLRYKRSPTNE